MMRSLLEEASVHLASFARRPCGARLEQFVSVASDESRIHLQRCSLACLHIRDSRETTVPTRLRRHGVITICRTRQLCVLDRPRLVVRHCVHGGRCRQQGDGSQREPHREHFRRDTEITWNEFQMLQTTPHIVGLIPSEPGRTLTVCQVSKLIQSSGRRGDPHTCDDVLSQT